ncbi:uncharacterized protein ACMZJ9_009869 [Mantella aurantiaca]
MDSDDLRHDINNFSFDRCRGGNRGFNRILIQLFGMLGHGKSSFINTCIYVWQDGEYENWANANEDNGSSTTERIQYELTRNITVVDNRGLPKLDEYGTGEIFAQLGNLLPLGKHVDWSPGFTLVDRIIESEKLVKDSDFIVPVFIHSVKFIPHSEEIAEMKSMLHTARGLTGIYPIVVLTRKNYGNLTTVETLFRDMGIERIFKFENYTREDHFKTRGRHEELLMFLQEVIKDVQFRVEHETEDLVKRINVRKQFVINFVHRREMKKEKEDQWRRKIIVQEKKKKELLKQEEVLERERQRRREAEEDQLRRRREEPEKQRLDDQARQEEKLPVQGEGNVKRIRKWFSQKH